MMNRSTDQLRFLLLLILLLATQSFAQTTVWQAFKDYEHEKKEKATGYLLSLAFPGGGLFYAGNSTEGLLFCASGILVTAGYIKNADEGRTTDASTALIALVALKCVELIRVSSVVDDYNEQLLSRIGLNIISQRMGDKYIPSLQISLKP